MIDVERDEFRVPFFIEKKGYRVQDRIVDMFITQDNKKLSDIEVAEVFHRLHHRFEMSVGDIAKKIGKSPAYVSDMLELITADNETISLVRNGKVKATAVVAAIKETKKEIKDKTAPANTIQNAAVHEKIVNAVEKAKSEGKSVAGKRHVSPRKDVPLSNFGRIKEINRIMQDQNTCVMVTDILDEVVNFIEFNSISIAEQIERFKQICKTYSK